MLTRRTLLAGALPLPGLPRADMLHFRIVRKGSPIGTHVLRFEPTPNGVAITIAVDIAVRFGPFVVYRYTLRGREIWQDGRCVAASATTDDDGTPQFMRATRGADGLKVQGSDVAPYVAPADAMVASHWNQAELRGPWINLQNGKLLHPRVEQLGPDPVRLADGTEIAASCFSITGPAQIRIWYTPSSVWTGLLFVARDGSQVHYERMT
jgi:hypothetical protein